VNLYKRYTVSPATVGDWDGAEELAATQLNRIIRAINRELPPSVDPQIARNVFARVWGDWGHDLRLLDAREDEIHRYARRLLRTAM
jgi:hypothetical protein